MKKLYLNQLFKKFVAKNMKTRNRNLFVICCFILLITACSNEPSIKSATADKVIIGGPPEKYTTAYELAKNECQKNSKKAQYIPDDTTDLKEVAFKCVGDEAEAEVAIEETATEAAAEETTTETEEAPPTEAVAEETAPETEDASAQ
jgi:hypothetical protein